MGRRNATFRRPSPQFLHDALVKIALDQAQHPTIRDLLVDHCQQSIFGDRVEVTFQVRIDHIDVASFQLLLHNAKGVMAATTPAKAEAAFVERVVKDRLDHVHQSRLHDPVGNGRNS